MMENIKVALVHDWLTGQRGGEKVLEALAEVFPEAPIYTLFHFAGSQIEAIEKKVIRTSFLQRMPLLKKHYRSYLPFFPMAAELFDLQRFDLVISSSHCVVKGIIPHPDALHVSYVHSPVRYAWNQYHAYFSREKLSFFSNLLIPPLIHYLRQWDVTSSARVDHFIANSHCVARRVEKYYRRSAEVIHPPVDTDFFRPADVEPERTFDLIVSALVPYKMIDLAITAYNQLGWPLKIVGDGPDFRKLRRLAGPNIGFLGSQEGVALRRLYQSARVLVLPGEEDFGISTLEAQACGTPVVAYGRGGSLETVLEGTTGLYFNELRPSSLLAALDKLRGVAFNKMTLRAHAQGFSRDIFKDKIRTAIDRKWRAFKEAT
jgi:glycosyltransferase involved in cell wall biosynthesis